MGRRPLEASVFKRVRPSDYTSVRTRSYVRLFVDPSVMKIVNERREKKELCEGKEERIGPRGRGRRRVRGRGRGKREEGRGKREEGRRKREEVRGKREEEG